MEISFASKKLENQMTDFAKRKKTFGRLAEAIQNRLSEFITQPNLECISTAPPPRRHKRTNETTSWTVDLSRNQRLLFRSTDGQTDPILVTSITILGVIDPH